MKFGLSHQEIDHSSGHAFFSKGEIYYSPNCSRRVVIPEYLEDYPYPFHRQNAQYERFLSPRWWTRLYHYLVFVTLRPSFDGLVFDCLREFIPDIISYGDGNKYGLAPQKVSQWKDLEDGLLMLAFLLNKHYPSQVRGALRPSLPSFLGFGRAYSDHRTARLCIAASRDWFLMWIALISSKLADVFSLNEPEDAKDWFSLLTDDNIPQAWLSSVETSGICTFSRQYPRVGTFLNIHKHQLNQPSVQWFIAFHIPVWYSWHPGDPHTLKPPPHFLQDATTFITKSPSRIVAIVLSSVPPSVPFSPHRRPTEYSSDEYRKARQSYLTMKPWEFFFADHAERNKRAIAKESEQDRMAWLNRERKPPRVSVDVYLWDWSKDGAIELVRTRVSKQLHEDTLADHSNSQTIYDPVSNVWDCCEYFGESSDHDCDDYDYDYECDIYPTSSGSEVGAAPQDHERILNERVEEVKRNLSSYSIDVSRYSEHGPETNLEHAVGQLNVHEYLHCYYGFLGPLPIPPADSHNDWAECIKCVGLDAKVNKPIPGLTVPIVNFIKGMQRTSGPEAFEWDHLADSRNPLTKDVISMCLRKLLNSEFLLLKTCLRNDRPHDWYITLTTSANALYVTRWLIDGESDNIPIEEVAQHLAEEGIPFHMYITLDPLPSTFSLSGIKVAIPRRIANYKFTIDDYRAYVSERNRLLSTPRGRAAILRGGIVGRIAKECLGIDTVLSGPLSVVTTYRLGCSVGHSNGTFWDDHFTNDETAIICGMFYCYTGNRDQIAKLSWWPLPEYWDHTSNSYNWGHWTEWDEHW